MSEGNPTVGTQAGEVHSQVCSPPPATNMIGNPMHSSTQADLPSNPDPVSSSPGDAPQPDYTGAQPLSGNGSPRSPPVHVGDGALEDASVPASANATRPAVGNVVEPSVEERQAELFYHLRCLHGVPEDGLSLISNTLQGIEKKLQADVYKLVGEELRLAAISTEAAAHVLGRVKGRMEESPLLYTPDLSSKYRRKRYFERRYPIVHPIFVCVPEVQQLPPRFYVRFDITDLLNRFFSDEHVQNSFRAFTEAQTVFSAIADQATADGMAADVRIHSVTEGTRYREKCGASAKYTVPIILYLDGFGSNDPAGSKGNLHKILGIYVGVAASPTTYSERKSIFLLSLVRNEEVKTHGIHHFVEEIVNDIDMARNQPFRIAGVDVVVDLLHVIGDNLESNGLAGLGGGFTRLVDYVCRHCEITSDEYSTVGSYKEMKEKSFARTHERYLHHQQSYRQTRNKSLSKGIVSRSALQDFQGFDLAADLPSCHVHNFFGGVYSTAVWHVAMAHWQRMVIPHITPLGTLNRYVCRYRYVVECLVL